MHLYYPLFGLIEYCQSTEDPLNSLVSPGIRAILGSSGPASTSSTYGAKTYVMFIAYEI